MKPTILVIENSASVRRLVEMCLKPLGADIIGSADGVSGLEAAAEMHPAVIVLDIGLPGIDGWEVLKRLRSTDATRGIKVLILTAHCEPDLASQAQDRDADGFVTKPFHPADLRNRVADLLAADCSRSDGGDGSDLAS